MEKVMYSNPKKALLVIDVQEDYTGTTAKSPFPYKNSEKLIVKINEIIDEAKVKNMLVIYIRQEFDGVIGKMVSRLFGHNTAIKGKPGTEIDKRIKFVSNFIFAKPMPDAFTNRKLGEFIKEQQVNELYLVGLDAAGCVFHTAKGGIKNECDVTIITDRIALLVESKWNKLLQQYKKEGINLIESKDF